MGGASRHAAANQPPPTHPQASKAAAPQASARSLTSAAGVLGHGRAAAPRAASSPLAQRLMAGPGLQSPSRQQRLTLCAAATAEAETFTYQAEVGPARAGGGRAARAGGGAAAPPGR